MTPTEIAARLRTLADEIDGGSVVVPNHPAPEWPIPPPVSPVNASRYAYIGMVAIQGPWIVNKISHDCQWTREGFLNAMSDAAQEVGKPVTVINGTPFSGDCPTSPPGSHREGNGMDYLYYADDLDNIRFVVELVKRLPKCRLRMDQVIKDRLMLKASPDIRPVLVAAIQGDTPPGAYRHDEHCHIDRDRTL